MTVRKIVLTAALAILGLVVVAILAVIAAFYAIFYFPNRTNAITGSIVSSGQVRESLLYVPGTYDRTRPTPLVISAPLPQFLVGGYSRSIDATAEMWAFFRPHRLTTQP